MSKKFNLDDYKGKYVMHCKTEEEAKDFCRVLHEAGRKWNNDSHYLYDTKWNYNQESTCYNFNKGSLSSAGSYLAHGYAVLSWSDFMNKKFTIDDLKNLDVVLRRDGSVAVFLADPKLLVFKGGFNTPITPYYNSNLTAPTSNNIDIVAVRRPLETSDVSFDAFEKKLGRVVYERDETVEMTLEEVCKALGKNVKIVKE